LKYYLFYPSLHFGFGLRYYPTFALRCHTASQRHVTEQKVCATITFMKMKRLSQTPKLMILMWLAFVLVACNLGGGAATPPPTLAPRNTATAQATLGFSGDGGQPVELAPSNLSNNAPNITVELYNLMEQVDVNRLRSHVTTLQNFSTRHVNSATNRSDYGIGAARSYIANEFNTITASSAGRFVTQVQYFDMTYNGIPTQQQNIVAVLQGTVPGAGFIVLGAHYDSINTTFTDATGFAPGANDNGSGVAALIEIARVMSQRQYRSSIIFVAFSAEEVNRQGSRAFVNWARQNGVDIKGMVNMDGIGNSANARTGGVDPSLRIFSCEDEEFCRDGGLSRQMARSVEFLGYAHEAPLEMRVERQGDRDGRYGDHYSFVEAGYPSIRFISTLEEWGNGSSSDTIDFVEWDYLRQSTQSIMLITVALADGLPPPRNISLRAMDNGSSVLVWDGVETSNGYFLAFRRANTTRYDGVVKRGPEDGTSLLYDERVSSGDWVAVAIGSIGQNGLVGWLSQEYALPAP
jgi:leucyl aminopeptidase